MANENALESQANSTPSHKTLEVSLEMFNDEEPLWFPTVEVSRAQRVVTSSYRGVSFQAPNRTVPLSLTAIAIFLNGRPTAEQSLF